MQPELLAEPNMRSAWWRSLAFLAAFGLAGCSILPFGRGGGDGEPRLQPVFELDATAWVELAGLTCVAVQMTSPTVLTGLRQPGSGTAARVRWTVDVLARPSGDQIHEVSWVQTIAEPDLDTQRSIQSRTFDVSPGDVLVAVTAEDEATGESYTVRQELSVPDVDGPIAILGVRLEALRETGWGALVSRSAPVDLDSLRLRAQVLNAGRREARILAERVEADSSIAEPPFSLGRQPDGLPTRGVVLTDELRDTTFVEMVELRDELGSLSIPVPRVSVGAYRLRVEVGEVRRDRFLIVRRVGFPEVERVGDLVAAMQYITTEGEQRALTARLDPYLQRRAFDRFWAERIPDRRLASATVRAYAERVEEANRRFSTQKEGWKTDQGMALVLFGLPQRVERSIGAERWIYSSGPVAGLALEFEATDDLPADWPYDVWTMRRGPAYDVAWQRARRAWRRGDVP